MKQLKKSLMDEFQNLVQTIVMGKIGILNSAVLHLDDVKNVTKSAYGRLTITDLMN